VGDSGGNARSSCEVPRRFAFDEVIQRGVVVHLGCILISGTRDKSGGSSQCSMGRNGLRVDGHSSVVEGEMMECDNLGRPISLSTAIY
jgi:hypothetical protein